MKRTLITGASGYLGSRLVAFFQNSRNRPLLLAGRSLHQLRSLFSDQHSFVEYTQILKSGDGLDSVDTVIHLAAMNEIECLRDPVSAYRVNTQGTQDLVHRCIEAGVRRFLFVSTIHVYGNLFETVVDENSTTHGTHPYAWSHRLAENHIWEADTKGLLEGVVVRLSNSFGYPLRSEMDRWTLLVNDLCRGIAERGEIVLHTDGRQKRDFIPLSDVVRALEFLCNVDLATTKNKVFNLCSGFSLSIRDMAEQVADAGGEVFGRRPPISVGTGGEASTLTDRTYSNAKLLDLGFAFEAKPHFELIETLRRCRDWFGAR